MSGLPKKASMRMCVACRVMQDKRTLTRVVRLPEGGVRIDTTGRANGRGAYLCNSLSCIERAQKIKALERALECPVPGEVFTALKERVNP